MRADGDEGSREMEARVKTWKGLDIEEWKEVHLRGMERSPPQMNGREYAPHSIYIYK